MQGDIERVLISRQQIGRRVGELAERIVRDHAAGIGESAEITIVPILTGAMIFCGDLIRHMPLRLKIGVMSVSSYPGRRLRAEGAQLVAQQVGDLRGRHVLLIDDILDSGGTLQLVVPILRSLGPASLKVCVLLCKDRLAAKAVAAELPVDYVGFEIPDEFVVGYGLDYNDYYRNLPDIVTLRKDVLRPEN